MLVGEGVNVSVAVGKGVYVDVGGILTSPAPRRAARYPKDRPIIFISGMKGVIGRMIACTRTSIGTSCKTVAQVSPLVGHLHAGQEGG